MLAEVSAITTPRAVTVAPPSEVTFPPKVAVVLAMLALVGNVTVGAPAIAMVRPKKGFVQPVVPL